MSASAFAPRWHVKDVISLTTNEEVLLVSRHLLPIVRRDNDDAAYLQDA